MTNKQVMQLMTVLGLHEGGMLNWIKDNAYVKFARKLETLVRDDERAKCAADYLQDCVNAVEAARLEEREACALLVENYVDTYDNIVSRKRAAAVVRARGNE
jgi:hypothetical protein